MVYFVWNGEKIYQAGDKGWQELMQTLEKDWIWEGEAREWERRLQQKEIILTRSCPDWRTLST